MVDDCVDRSCKYCGTKMKALFNVSLYCPNDCDRVHSPNTKWYSYYTSISPGTVVDCEMYLTHLIDVIKNKVSLSPGVKVWQVEPHGDKCQFKNIGGNIFQGGPVKVVCEVKNGT